MASTATLDDVCDNGSQTDQSISIGPTLTLGGQDAAIVHGGAFFIRTGGHGTGLGFNSIGTNHHIYAPIGETLHLGASGSIGFWQNGYAEQMTPDYSRGARSICETNA